MTRERHWSQRSIAEYHAVTYFRIRETKRSRSQIAGYQDEGVLKPQHPRYQTSRPITFSSLQDMFNREPVPRVSDRMHNLLFFLIRDLYRYYISSFVTRTKRKDKALQALPYWRIKSRGCEFCSSHLPIFIHSTSEIQKYCLLCDRMR